MSDRIPRMDRPWRTTDFMDDTDERYGAVWPHCKHTPAENPIERKARKVTQSAQRGNRIRRPDALFADFAFLCGLCVQVGLAIVAWAALLCTGSGCGSNANTNGTTAKPQVAAGAAASKPAQWFTDISSQAGVNFVHEAGATGTYFLPEIMGAGAAFLDFDNDGRLDILLINGNRDLLKPADSH